MSCMRELDFIEQTKYGSSTLKKEEKLPTAQLQMVFTRTEFGFRRRAKQHKMDTWEVVGDSGSNGDLDPEAEGEKVQLHKLSKNQASFVPEGEPSAVPSFASEGELSRDTRIYDLWIRGEEGPCL